MAVLAIQKYPKFNDAVSFDDIIAIEEIFDEEEIEDCKYRKEIIDFYKPFYKRYKEEKYWYNISDGIKRLRSQFPKTIREDLLVSPLPEGVINWIEKHSDGSMDTHCVLTKELLERLLRLCWDIKLDKDLAKLTFPSEEIISDDYSYFNRIFKLATVLPYIIRETDFDKYEVVCSVL